MGFIGRRTWWDYLRSAIWFALLAFYILVALAMLRSHP